MQIKSRFIKTLAAFEQSLKQIVLCIFPVLMVKLNGFDFIQFYKEARSWSPN